MSDLLQIIVDQAAQAKPKPVVVPEWKTTVYFLPLTPAERIEIRRGIDPNDQEDLLVSTLQHKARDAEGNRIFDCSVIERAKLMKSIDMEVLQRVLIQAGSSVATDEEDLKND